MQTFTIGKSYRLDTSLAVEGTLSGEIKVVAEIKPKDSFGIRVLLIDCHTADGVHLLGKRLFVEGGVAQRNNEGCLTEIGIVQGIFPYVGKVYAIDEVVSMVQNKEEVA